MLPGKGGVGEGEGVTAERARKLRHSAKSPKMAKVLNFFTNSKEKAFFNACCGGDAEKVQQLLKDKHLNLYWKNSHHMNGTAIYYAVLNGQTEVMKLVVTDPRFRPNDTGKDRSPPFLLACEGGFLDLVKLLASDSRVDINMSYNSGTPFQRACHFGFVAVADYLLTLPNVKKPEDYQECLLYASCRSGEVNRVRELLESKMINLNWISSNGSSSTVLHTACEFSYIEIVKILLADERLDPNQADRFGNTPTHSCCNKHPSEFTQRQGEILELLLADKRVDLLKRNNNGFTSLKLAERKENEKATELIQSANTPQFTFWKACKEGDTEKVKEMLALHPAFKNFTWRHPCFPSMTALAIAVKNGHTEVVQLLEKEKPTEPKEKE